MLNSILDTLVLMDKYYEYLSNAGVEMTPQGLPCYKEDMFLKEKPDIVVPYSKRTNKRVEVPQKTVLCFFDKDRSIYTRFEKVFSEIDEYKKFLGVIGADVTISDDMELEWKLFVVTLNQLFNAILAINDIKIVLNTRSSDLPHDIVFSNYPKNVMCASSFLGCKKESCNYDFEYVSKVLFVLPSQILLYGKRDKIVESQFDTLGIEYTEYLDFHALCLNKKEGG